MATPVQLELDKGALVFPVLKVDWTARGLAIQTDYIAPGANLAGVPLRAKSVKGGWGPIQYGPGVRGSTLATSRTTVRVEDKDRTLTELLETFNPRGSQATISWASSRLVEADWEVKFFGLVEDWEAREGGFVELILKTNEQELRSPAPKPQFSRASWPTASDPGIFATTVPLLFGIHDSFRVTVRGQVRALNVRRDESTPTALQFYAASLGNLTTIERVYYDGIQQVGLSFQVLRGLFGGVYQTILAIERDDAPPPEVVVSFDLVGPDDTGGTTGPPMVNPVTQCRVFLEEYTFRDNQTGVYVGAHPLIEQTSWAAVEAFFEARDYETGVILGGGGSRPLGLDIVESFLNSYPFLRMWWNETGQIELHLIDYTDADPDADAWLVADRDTVPGSFKYQPGDRKDVFNRIEMPFLFSDMEGKFLAQHEAHDVDSIENPLARLVSNPWSQARYDRT